MLGAGPVWCGGVLLRVMPRSSPVLHLLLFLVALLPAVLFAQEPGLGGYGPLKEHLKALADARSDAARDSANALVKQDLAIALSTDSAFTASFAGVPISHLDAPDGAFRLFTWNMPRMDGSYRYEGFLLVKERRKQKLYALRDMTGHIAQPATAQLSPENWYGAVYYDMIPVKHGGRTYYTLLGWKGFSPVETRKVIEVIRLGGSMPRFGAPLFEAGRQRHQRIVYAYAAQASMLLRWMPERKAIVADHLSPTRPEFAGQPAFMAPDLSFDSYTWDKDHWQLNSDIDLRGNERRPFNAPPKQQR